MKIFLAIIILLFPTLGFSQLAGEGPIKFKPDVIHAWQLFNSQYVKGNFNTTATVANFAISQDGKFADFYYCKGTYCRFNPYDSIAHCEKRSNRKCFIFANRTDNIVWKNPGDFLNNEAVEARKNEPIYGQGYIKFDHYAAKKWEEYRQQKDGEYPEKVFIISKKDAVYWIYKFYNNKYDIVQILTALEKEYNNKFYVFAINNEIKWEDPGDFLPK